MANLHSRRECKSKCTCAHMPATQLPRKPAHPFATVLRHVTGSRAAANVLAHPPEPTVRSPAARCVHSARHAPNKACGRPDEHENSITDLADARERREVSLTHTQVAQDTALIAGITGGRRIVLETKSTVHLHLGHSNARYAGVAHIPAGQHAPRDGAARMLSAAAEKGYPARAPSSFGSCGLLRSTNSKHEHSADDTDAGGAREGVVPSRT